MANGKPEKYGTGGAGSTRQYPIAYSFAFAALAALVLLAILRHLFGSVRIDIGSR